MPSPFGCAKTILIRQHCPLSFTGVVIIFQKRYIRVIFSKVIEESSFKHCLRFRVCTCGACTKSRNH